METITEKEVDTEFNLNISEIKELGDKTDEGLNILCRSIRGRLRKKFDLVIAISGDDTGIGKSSLGIHIGKGIQPDFDLRKNIAYLPREHEIRRKFNDVARYGCFDVDEAIKAFYKLNWQDKMQKMLNQDFMTNRKENYKCTELLIPNFTDLNTCFRNYKVKMNIYIPFRGVGVVYVKYKLPFDTDPWAIKENNKIMKDAMGKYRSSELDEDKTMDILSRPSNFAGIIYFPQLESELEKEYVRIFNEEKKRDEDEFLIENTTDPTKFARRAFIKLADYGIKNLGLTQTKIAEICGIGQPYIATKMKMFRQTGDID